MRLGALEIVLILVVVLVLFGGNKLAGVGKALGQSIRDFKKEIKSEDEKKEEQKAAKPEPPKVSAEEKLLVEIRDLLKERNEQAKKS